MGRRQREDGVLLRRAGTAAVALLAGALTARGRGTHAQVVETLPPPSSPAAQPAWLANLTAWRAATLASVNYSGAIYDTYLPWTNNVFVVPQSMVHDSYLYDAAAGIYTVPRFLEDLRIRYGGIGGVLLWQSYPNIGIDDRNQLTKMLDMPGGLDGLRALVADFHAAGVYVGWPLNPWDTCTAQPAAPYNVSLPALLASIVSTGCGHCTTAAHSTPHHTPLRHRVCREPTFSTATP